MRSAYGLDPKVISPTLITQKVIQGVYDGVTSTALDDLAAETAAYMTTQHPDYARLAARISVSNLHKMTDKNFASVMKALHGYINPKNGQQAPLISNEVLEIVQANAERLNAAIMYGPSQRETAPDAPRTHPLTHVETHRFFHAATTATSSTTTLDSRRSRSRTCCACTAKSLSAHSRCSCAWRSAFTSTTLRLPSRRVLRFAAPPRSPTLS